MPPEKDVTFGTHLPKQIADQVDKYVAKKKKDDPMHSYRKRIFIMEAVVEKMERG